VRRGAGAQPDCCSGPAGECGQVASDSLAVIGKHSGEGISGRLKCGWAQQDAAVKNCGLNAVVVLAPSSLLVAQVRSKN
jgi:hypothetical protein